MGNEWKKDPRKVYILARYMYRIGMPFMSDEMYERVQETIKKAGVLTDYLNRTYDDDPVPVDLIKESFGEKYIKVFDSSKYKDVFGEDKSLSITPVDSWRGIFEFCTMNKDKTLIASLKVDGVNQKTLYKKFLNNYIWEVTLSRGRTGESREYQNHKKIIRKTIPVKTLFDDVETAPEFLDLRGEVYTDDKGRNLLKEEVHNGNKFASGKSTALSMLTTNYEDKYYEYMHSLAFSCEGIADTVYDTFKKLEEMGYSTPPHMLIDMSGMPDDFEEFKKWFGKVLDKMYEEGKELGIPSDGVVLEINNLKEDYEVKGQYSDRSIACKIEYWAYKYYRGIITSSVDEQQRVKGSLVLTIEPLLTEDGAIATRVNVYNPSILINNNLKLGSEVYIERASGTVTNLIYGERLKKLLDTGELEKMKESDSNA